MKTVAIVILSILLSGSFAIAGSDITGRCQEKWGSKHEKRAWCIDKQLESNGKVVAWYQSPQRDKDIYQLCGKQCSDGYGMDWVMLADCINKRQGSANRPTGE